jgi:sugar O-acyltransferase (sialic acid O-acetyltransferase NeuD family)
MSAKDSIVIYGAGGHGKVIADALLADGDFLLAGFLDDTVRGTVFGLPVLGGKEKIPHLVERDVCGVVVAVGNPAKRRALTRALENAGMNIKSAIHPMAYVAHGSTIGRGTVVLPHAVIGADSIVGEGCIINTGATVDHDCVLGDFVHIAPGAHLAGNVLVGDDAHIGIGSSVKEGVRIGRGCMIGAGSVVIGDIQDHSVAFGVPAVRQRSTDTMQ